MRRKIGLLMKKKHLFTVEDVNNIISVDYRQFDKRFTYYPLTKIHEIIVRGDSRRNLMQHYILGDNIGLIIGRQGQVVGNMPWNLAFVSDKPTDMNIFYRGGGINFPLYLYPEFNQHSTEIGLNRKPNLNSEMLAKFAESLDLEFVNEKESNALTFAPIDILDYVYAILYSPTYREKYKEFLKIDFPRIPYPKQKDVFWELVKAGERLRSIHLLSSINLDDYNISYPKNGSNEITTTVGVNDWEIIDKENQLGRIWLNEDQYFENIPSRVWTFYIGGYQPAQKWLKDRKNKTLEHDDISHYRKLIAALVETCSLMDKLEKIDI